jgi:hypothetical protein
MIMADYEDDNDGVAEEIDDTPNWVKEGTEEDDFAAEGENISEAEQMVGGSDAIDPAKNVELIVKQVKVDKYVPEEKDGGRRDKDGNLQWKTARMELWLAVGPKGTDGKGRYKGKMFFPRIGFAVNRKAGYDFSVNAKGKPTQYYEPKGGFFGDYNAFLAGLGFKTDPAPLNDNKFRKALIDRSLLVDIEKDRKQAKNKMTGEYERVNEYEIVLVYKPAKAAKVEQQVEAAAS